MEPDWYVRLAGPVAVGLDPFFDATWPIGPKFFTDLGAANRRWVAPRWSEQPIACGASQENWPGPDWLASLEMWGTLKLLFSLSLLRVSPTSSHTIAEQSASESRFV